jgi:hypothetical protein
MHLFGYIHSRVTAPSAQDAALSQLKSLQKTSVGLNRRIDVARRISHLTPGSTDAEINALIKALSMVDKNIEQINFRSMNPSEDATEIDDSGESTSNRWRAMLPGAANLDQFQRVGHLLLALLSGVLGGMVAVWFYARRQRAKAAAREP